MKILLSNVKILDATSSLNGTTTSIRIENGTIQEIANDLKPQDGEKVIDHKGLTVSPGWFDASVSVGEPGYEDRENLQNALKVAAKSGFTAMAVNPNNDPIPDSGADISYLIRKSEGNAVKIYPIGALTLKGQGVDLAELHDMKLAGAAAYGDYQHPIENPNLLKIALQYTQGFDGLVLSFPQENQLVGKGIVHEGEVSTRLGLKGIPAFAEELHIARDLKILEYTGGKLHIPTISTKGAVELIKEAKAEGLQVTCGVAVANLIFTDEKLEDFDTRYKVMPPLRDESHRQALIKGVKDGTIDLICSDHNPLDIEKKKLEFDNAMFGTVSQEATFGALNALLGEELTVKMLTAGKSIFGAKPNTISTGEEADLTLFTTEEEYIFKSTDVLSKSKNAAFQGSKLKGKAIGIIANNQVIL